MEIEPQILVPAFSIRSLNWLLLTLCIVIVILVSFFLFYWNRFLGWMLGCGLRFLWWKRYRMWIECESIQFAFLAGRILLKDVQYHSSNMSIRVLHCHITWRYWLWKTREGEDVRHNNVASEGLEKSNPNQNEDLPCRVHVFLEGVEWFIYNRTPSYDAIIEKFGVPDVLGPELTAKTPDETPQSAVLTPTYPPTPSSSPHLASLNEDDTVWNRLRKAAWRLRMPEIDFNEILPVGLAIRKGALTIGNDSTPSILIMDISGGNGTYGVLQSRSKFDEYKVMYDVRLEKVKIITRTNPDYREKMLGRGKEIHEHILAHASSSSVFASPYSFGAFHELAHRLNLVPAGPLTTSLSAQSQRQKKWGGLARYHADNDSEEKSGVLHEPEYAKVTCLLDTPALSVIYYADTAGKVPQHPKPVPMEHVDIGNGDEAPEWGIELELHGGPALITYGPWADRQRVHWQQMLTPPTYQNTQPTAILKPGDLRQSTSLRISVRFRDVTKIRVPTRESSKDWRYDGFGDLDAQRRRHRPYGWLDLQFEADSFLKYDMPMVASRKGFLAILDVNLKKVTAFSSVNQVEFLRADRCCVRAMMPGPHIWNAKRIWKVETNLTKPNIKLLRDHVNLLTDLVGDWTSSSPPGTSEETSMLNTEEYERFVPVVYDLKVSLENYRLDLYANDHNIIDWPLSHVDNSILSLTGQSLNTALSVRSDEFRPIFSSTPFKITAPGINITISMPKWNTHSAFATPRTGNIGLVESLVVSGSYTSYSDIRPDAVDRLRLDIEASGVVFKAFGWAVRHLMVIKENYFGMFTNFTTRNEFLNKLHEQNIGDPVRGKYREGRSNPFEVDLGVLVSDSLLILPQEVYDCQAGVVLEISDLQLILRLHAYAMEMSLNVSPIPLVVLEDLAPVLKLGRIGDSKLKDRLSLQGLDIIANRFFGPEPEVATYLCLWEILPSEISGALSIASVVGLQAAIRAFRINFSDDFNAPSTDFTPPTDPDVTFLRVKCPLVDVTVGLGDSICTNQINTSDSLLHFSLPKGFSVQLTDRPNQAHASCMRFDVPVMSARIIQRVTGFHQTWFELASISLDLAGEQTNAPLGWKGHAEEQLNFLRAQDGPTRRAAALYGSNSNSTDSPRHGGLTYLVPLRVPDGFGNRETSGSVIDSAFDHKEYEDSFRSEQDDVLTEASRDARVANSRPVTPQVASGQYIPALKFRTRAPDGDMSSGDESDNDSTDYEPSLSSSIVPPGDDASIETTPWPHADHYRQALRRYRPVYSGYNTSYETYCLKHDPARSFDSQPEELGDSPRCQPRKRDPQDHENTETFRVTVQRHLTVVVTPTCIPFVCNMLTELDTHSHRLDLLADAILDEFMDTTSANQNHASRSLFSVEVPSIKIQFLQSIMSSTEADALSTETHHHSAVPIHVDARVLALFDVQVHQASCRLETLATASTQHTSIVMEAALIDSRLRTLVSKPFAHSRYQIEPSSDKLRFKITGAKLDLSNHNSYYAGNILCTTFDIFVSNKSPEILMTTIAASSHSLGRATSFLESRSDLLSRRRRYFIWTTIGRLQGQSVAPDPFATNLPSFLVQTGRPGRLRSDPSWKTLTIIRQSIRQMGSIEKNALQSSLTNQTNELLSKNLEELLPVMETQWSDLYGQDESGLPRIPPILRSQFPAKTTSTSPFHFRGILSVVCPRAKIILQSYGADYNEVVASDFKMNLRTSTMEYTPVKSIPIKLATTIPPEKAIYVIGSVAVRQISVSVYPSCVLFVRQVLRVQRQINSTKIPMEDTLHHNAPYSPPFHHVVFEWAFSASSLGFAAPAQQITFEAHTYGCSANTVALVTLPAFPASPRGSLSVTLAANRVSAQASQGKSQKSNQTLLAGIDLRNVMVHGALKEEPGVITKARLLMSLDKFKIHVPRSVLRLYRFIDSWRTEYLPTYDSMFQDLLSELDRDPHPNNSKMFKSSPFSGEFTVDVQAQLREFSTELHVMHGTWLTWNVLNSITYVDSKGLSALKFGHRIGSQVIHLTSGQPGSQRLASGANSVYLELPSLRLEGKYPHLDVHLHVDRFSVTLKPQYVDDFLAIQQKFGSDFNELVDLAVEFRSQRGMPTTKPSNDAAPSFPRFDISFVFEGFRVGIEGPSSTQYLDSSSIKGQVHSGAIKRWSFSVESLALSLAHHSAPRRTRSNFDRKYRSAYMVLDMAAENIEHPETAQEENHLGVVISFVHAVMQPAAIAELGDLIDHIQAEMLSRQEQRAQELEEVRRKTRQVMRTLESNEHPHATTESKTFLDNRKIEFTVQDIGIAFPLTLQDDLMLPQMESSTITPLSPSSVQAFLISLSSISFVTQRYETGQAKLAAFSFQFVPGFDQSQPSHFNGNTHKARNRMLYPSMEADIRSETTSAARQIWIRAHVSGFEVDLEPAIAGYLFSIVDVYRQGRDRVARLATYAPRSDTASSTGSLAPLVTSSAQYSAVLTTNIKASFEFKSGHIRSHTPNVRANDPERSQSLPDFTTEDEIFEHGVDNLDLPMVTAWLEYRATPASQKVPGSTSSNQSTLVCNTTIHPISNVLRPSLLPFLADLFKRVQERLAQAPAPPQSPYVPPFSDLSTIHEGLSLDDAPDENSPVIGSMQVIFSLDINKSTLELTCQPDVNVVAGLNWEKGGFVITISPGAREVAVVGTLSSITAGIQHGYLNEDSVSAKAQNLAFSVDFRKLKGGSGLITNSVSVVVNTEVGAEMRFSRLQDLLCFKAVWLDRIPVFDSLARPAPVPPTPAIIKAELPGGDYITPTQPFQTLVLVNINKANIIADLGQTISKTMLDIESLAFRTKLCEEVSEATLTIARLELLSERAVVGFVHMPDFVFQTVRRRHGKLYHDQEGHSKMLELVLKSGDIEAAMEYERQHLMHFHADPLHVTVFDDWSRVTPKIPINEREVLLEFNIQAGEILAYASTATIPKMITVGGKLSALIKAQKQGAARESNAFRASQMPKPDTALSEVAAVMLQSARSRFKETETFQFAIIQRLTLSIKTLKLAVPPVTQQRSELALFSARQVDGELHRTIRPHEPPCRNLRLRLGAFSIRGVAQPNTPNMQMTAHEILATFPYGTRLFLFPDTRITMQTTQQENKVSYNFAINLADRLAGEKGIYVALSFASWNWLLGIKRRFETDLEAALAEAAISGKDTPPMRRRKTIDTDPGLSSAEEEGMRSVYHSPMMTPRSQTPTGSTPASPRGATMPISANVISVEPIRGSRGLEYEESTSQVSIDAPTLEVLGRATPDISNTPTFKGLKKALPTWVHEYTTLPIEEIMNVLLEVYSKQLRSTRSDNVAE